jgi:chitinase
VEQQKNNMTRVLLAIVMLGLSLPAMSQRQEVIGYYPSWKWRSRNNLVSPARIPYDKLTVINYAFFYPLPDGTLVGRDTVGDALILRGERDMEGSGFKPGTALTDVAHRHGVKVMLSIGGWEDSNNFPEVASSDVRRARFAHSCLEQIRTYGFDGIDIDWEYPGYADHKGTPDDRQNFTRLLQVVRDSLENYGRATGERYSLTAALPAGASALTTYEMDKIAVLLDRLNVMTYDFNGPWDSLSGHNAPLYAPRPDDSLRNVDAAFNLYVHTLNVPAEKVNLGVPFYGQTYTQCTSLYARHGGADTVHFSPQGAFYYDIVPLLARFTRRWDDRAKVPYLVSAAWNVLISYDDEESVRYKAQYVLDHHACGLIIWEITGDYLPDGRTPLLDAIDATFRTSPRE